MLRYFSKFNITADLAGVYFCDACNVLDMMDCIDPNSEIWQYGYIGFVGDFEGRTYCFDQNVLNASGEPTIIRFDYPVGEDPSAQDLSSSATRISDSLEDFVTRYLAGEFS